MEEKGALMRRMGRKELRIELSGPLAEVPKALAGYGLVREDGGRRLLYVYDAASGSTGITRLMGDLRTAGLHLVDIETRQSNLEEIFVGLVKDDA